MEYSKKKISKICFGCEVLGGKDWGKFNLKEIEEGIEQSIELGLNFFDTADVYGLGLSEERLSKILGHRRHEFFIGTKGGIQWKINSNARASTFKNSSPKYINECVDKSLKRLRLDILPIYYIHWPDTQTKIERTFELLQKLVEKEKIKYLGCSNFNIDQIQEASRVADISFIQMPVNILNSPISETFKKFCKKSSIGVVAYNSLASGLLTGKYNKESKFPENDRRSRLSEFKGESFFKLLDKVNELKLTAEQEKLFLSQYAIKHTLSIENIESVIVGIKNREQAFENINWINGK